MLDTLKKANLEKNKGKTELIKDYCGTNKT